MLFEAPHRIRPMLEDLRTHLGERFVVLARELTKIHETISRGWVSDLLAGGIDERGEYVVLVSDQVREVQATAEPVSDESLKTEFCLLTNNRAISARDAVAALADRHHISKQRVYKATRS